MNAFRSVCFLRAATQRAVAAITISWRGQEDAASFPPFLRTNGMTAAGGLWCWLSGIGSGWRCFPWRKDVAGAFYL